MKISGITVSPVAATYASQDTGDTTMALQSANGCNTSCNHSSAVAPNCESVVLSITPSVTVPLSI